MSAAMLWAITVKEFYKIRWFWLVVLAINLAAVAYVYLETRAMFRREHAEMVWYQMLQLGLMPYDGLRYLPVATGLLLGLVQFLPEMRRERLRLSLHLPVPPELLVFSLLGAGLVALGLVLAVDALALRFIMNAWTPPELTAQAMASFTPWAVSGVAVYLGSALALLEPAPWRRLLYLVMAAGLAAMGLDQAAPATYGPALPLMILLTLLLIPAILLPAYRYRYRSAE